MEGHERTDARIGGGEAGARAGVIATIGTISEVGNNVGRTQTLLEDTSL
jgi:hypothetical protein